MVILESAKAVTQRYRHEKKSDLALHRLAKKGTLRRLARGLYDYPRSLKQEEL
jgi:predicted transcriptional regulator of viral defense system